MENVSDIALFRGQNAAPGGLKATGKRQDFLDSLRKMLPYVTVNSRAFTIYSGNRFQYTKPMSEAPREIRHPARAIVKTLLYIDSEGRSRVIDWCYLTR